HPQRGRANLRWLAAQVHDRPASRCWAKILQSTCSESIHDLCELVGWAAGICRWCPFPESNQRTNLRSAGRNLVVGEKRMVTPETKRSTSNQAVNAGGYKRIVYIICAVAALGGLLFGLDQGFIANSLATIDAHYQLGVQGGERYSAIL